MAGRSAGVVEQPGARVGSRTHCPVSGVVFTVTEASPHRELDGRPVYFCCPQCAAYFSAHQEHVVATRGLRR